ncbi:hypothetical protein [Aquimarina sp. 2201CG5-10]|uniref:hypothetical protein n=1 Tax=Aquimarina callyspongiae TaxID=3098150 RepID=UPI002AB55A47|nr:hypothetical protein [Aquimarina sp. 2201CG5-10]MDY8137548.1 hypothetical protein [Aquimarina sp. 2201CG5-10]
MLETIGLTFWVLVLTYTVLNFSRLIVNFYDKTITPFVYFITDRSSIVLKTELDKKQQEVDRLEKRFRDEKALRFETQEENEKLERRLNEISENKVSIFDDLRTSDTDKSKTQEEDSEYVPVGDPVDVELSELEKDSESFLKNVEMQEEFVKIQKDLKKKVLYNQLEQVIIKTLKQDNTEINKLGLNKSLMRIYEFWGILASKTKTPIFFSHYTVTQKGLDFYRYTLQQKMS